MSHEHDNQVPDHPPAPPVGDAESARPVSPIRISVDGGPPVRDRCDVLVEDVLTIMVEGGGSITIMCTPTDTVALAAGFLFAEGIIGGAEDIVRLTTKEGPNVVAVRVEGPARTAASRNLIVTSSCGLCGSRNIERFIESLTPGEDSLRISPQVLQQVGKEMRDRQGLFDRTGGCHAAAIFSENGEIIAMGEDIGRHNAFDKAVGKCLLSGTSLRRRGAMLSGRISLEMLAKAARAGVELVAAVSAPSSLAVDVAERCHITLCGFVRADRATVYTHPHRITGLTEPVD